MYVIPAKACGVLSEATRRKAKLPVVKWRDPSGRGCEWANRPGPRGAYRPRSVAVDYDPGVGSDDAYAKRMFKESMARDYRRPSVFSRGPQEKGIVKRVGTSAVGEDYDEAYYVYYVDQVAGSRRGHGLLVIRKGNVIIKMNASGGDNFGTRVIDGKPISSKVAQDLLDATADGVLRAVEKAS
ncbi:MAG TPA: hypothetical protein VFV66_13835 [Nonomuraea sp.]|nr:hypothetical protein [Nonomuraea sp.]